MKQTIRRLGIILIASALAILASSALAAERNGPPIKSGQWIATGTDECPEGQICVVWELQQGGKAFKTDLNCCLEAELVGSTRFGACSSFRDPQGG
ncbi:MAG: hypothetical protein AAF604_14930 [Acidobacteriota bacterium]